MKNSRIGLIALFLAAISNLEAYSENIPEPITPSPKQNLIISPSKKTESKTFDYVQFLKNYNNNIIDNSSIVNIDKTTQELVNLSQDEYFKDQASRIQVELNIVISNAQRNNKKIDKNSSDYYQLKVDSLAMQNYIKEKYPEAYISLEKFKNDKESSNLLKSIPSMNSFLNSPLNDSAAVNTNVYANAEAVANAVVASNAVVATTGFVAAEVFIVIAAFVI
ncbi:hypothetical protein [Silvanigrella aquatica]|uniref:Uncharacterized protein n=1 Tax=Silvanigrella aquatica TaxID=1915309 RepID=A0A1L4D151_9BACT|nr:hypothetical protein [Silvanigrella aquatica]APJ03929.1 hypothetical protein AXG55_08435 [Silvanigrella aquatica]